MKSIIIPFILSTLLLNSCNDTEPFDSTKIKDSDLKPTVIKVDSSKINEPQRANEPQTPNEPQKANAIKPQPQTTQQTTPQSSLQITPQNTTVKTAAGMNPPHGEPGHRCDIAVGAPLNTPASTQTVQQTTPAKVVTPTGMNPPHGEPGHRCDIAIGAPLSSAPETKPADNKIDTTGKK